MSVDKMWRADDGLNFIEQEWEHPVCRIGITDEKGRDFCFVLTPDEMDELRALVTGADGVYPFKAYSIRVGSGVDGYISIRPAGSDTLKARLPKMLWRAVLWRDPCLDQDRADQLHNQGWSVSKLSRVSGLDYDELRRQLRRPTMDEPFKVAVEEALASEPESKGGNATTAESAYKGQLKKAGLSMARFSEMYGHSYWLTRQVVVKGQRDPDVERDLRSVLEQGGNHDR